MAPKQRHYSSGGPPVTSGRGGALPQQRMTSNIRCHQCGQLGHLRRHCPETVHPSSCLTASQCGSVPYKQRVKQTMARRPVRHEQAAANAEYVSSAHGKCSTSPLSEPYAESRDQAAARAKRRHDVAISVGARAEVLTLFNGCDVLGAEHLVALAEAASVDPNGIAMHVVVWKMECETPRQISRAEWCRGFASVGVRTVDQLSRVWSSLHLKVSSVDFRAFYNSVFDWVRGSVTASFVSCEDASLLWPVLFSGKGYTHLDDWVRYVRDVNTQNVSCDVWRMTLPFMTTSLESYDAEGAWPVFMDRFVAWKNGAA